MVSRVMRSGVRDGGDAGCLESYTGVRSGASGAGRGANARGGPGTGARYGFTAAEIAATGECIGFVGIKETDLAPFVPKGRLEIGWRLAPEFWGKGYVTEASRRWLDFAFEELEVLELGDVAVARSRYRQRGTLDGEDRTQTFLMTDVWTSRAGRPQLVTRHLSPLPT